VTTTSKGQPTTVYDDTQSLKDIDANELIDLDDIDDIDDVAIQLEEKSTPARWSSLHSETAWISSFTLYDA
jgi:hypothetical protein